MKTLRQLIESKNRPIVSISPEQTVLRALEIMAQHDVGALLVLDGDRLAGVFSERDYARKVILKGHSSRETPVSDIMTPAPTSVSPATTVDECMRLCTELRVRHLPVLENNKLVGIVSIGDLVKWKISEVEAEADTLKAYIATG